MGSGCSVKPTRRRTVTNMGNSPSDRDERLDDLAERLAASTDRAEQDAILRKMEPELIYVRRMAAGREGLRGSELELFAEEGVSRFWEKRGKYDPDKGARFSSWWWTVCRNEARDAIRKRKRGVVLPALGGDEQAFPERAAANLSANDGGDDTVSLQDCYKTQRALLDELRSKMAAESGKVNLFAVLLVKLRLATAAAIAKMEAEGGREMLVGGLAADYMRWRRDEEELSFRPGWPTLGEIWGELSPKLVADSWRKYAEMLVDVVNDRISGPAPFRGDLWPRWCKRAKELARSHISSENWERCFARLMPDHGRARIDRHGLPGKDGGDDGE